MAENDTKKMVQVKLDTSWWRVAAVLVISITAIIGALAPFASLWLQLVCAAILLMDAVMATMFFISTNTIITDVQKDSGNE